MTAASGRWFNKNQQLNALRDIVSLTHSSHDEDKVVKNIIRGVSDQLGRSSPVAISTILSDEQKGSITVTVWAPDDNGQFQHKAAGDYSGNLKALFHQWGNPYPRSFPTNDPESQWLRELLGAFGEVPIVSFPFHASGITFGMLGIQLPPDNSLTQEETDNIQQFTDVAALCLQNTRQYEAQARQTRELQQEDELRRSFLSYITHEFRTPLTSLKTSFELIQESEEMRGLDDPYQRLLVNVNRSVATLEQLINDLSEVANLSAGGVILNKTLTSPEVIVYPVSR